ncbi:MAG TPA: acetyltransferase [Cyclobacteriaceae bacterium]|nr:acetyltransferase [Cyclobacteriaceae bacterium]
MIHDIAIYGAGGFGRETAVLIDQINAVSKQWNVIGFFDDGLSTGTVVDGLSVLGGINELNQYSRSIALVVAIADPILRRSIVSKISTPNIFYPVIIHPSAIVEQGRNEIGKGSIITAFCILTTGISIGNFVIVNLATTIGHDVVLGDYCSIMPGCRISGNCKIGPSSMIGTGAAMVQNLNLGSECKVGAGAVIINSFEDGVTIVGVPGKKI